MKNLAPHLNLLQASQNILTCFALGRQLDFCGFISPLKIKISKIRSTFFFIVTPSMLRISALYNLDLIGLFYLILHITY